MVSIAPPKLRGDLTVRQQRSDGRVTFVVKDPTSGAFFRLREPEEFIVRQFDGDTSLEVIRTRVQERFGCELAPDTLKRFTTTLEQTGLLESGNLSARRKSAESNGRLAGSILYLRYRLFDPSGLFDRLSPWVGIFFTPAFCVLASLLILFAGTVAFSNSSIMVGELSRLLDPWLLALYVVLSCLTVSLHEFAHGLTCRRFGGEVQDMGFLLVYFQPAFYCNVSDAWLFPEKSKRLLVSFAGPFFELFLWALAVLLWRITDADSTIHLAALIVGVGSGVKTLFNFNPFIKLDGYYLLSDALEIPNLRKKSFRYAGALFRRLVGLNYHFPEVSSRRERWIYLAYGLIATCTSIGLMCFVLVKAAGYVAELGAGTIPAIFVVIFTALRLRDWGVRLFGRSSKAAPTDDDEDDGEDTQSSASRAEAQPKSDSSVKWLRWMRRLAWVTALFAVGTFLGRRETDLRVFGEFRAMPANTTDVRSAVEGIISDVFVEEGDQVRAGDRIARLSDRDLRTSLDQNTAELRENEAKLRMLEAGPSAQEIAVAQAGVTSAEQIAQYAQKRYDQTKMLIEAGVLAKLKLDEMAESVIGTTGGLHESRARLNALVNSVRPEQIEATRAHIERLQTEGNYIKTQMAMLEITTPVGGVIGTPSLQLRQLRQQSVKKGDRIASVHDARMTTAEILVSEKDISEVRVGQPVELMIRAHPGVKLIGKVTAIAVAAVTPITSNQTLFPVSSSSQKSGTLLVKAQLEDNPLLLKPDMTGQSRIFCGRRTWADLIAWRAARMLNTEFWSWL